MASTGLNWLGGTSPRRAEWWEEDGRAHATVLFVEMMRHLDPGSHHHYFSKVLATHLHPFKIVGKLRF